MPLSDLLDFSDFPDPAHLDDTRAQRAAPRLLSTGLALATAGAVLLVAGAGAVGLALLLLALPVLPAALVCGAVGIAQDRRADRTERAERQADQRGERQASHRP